MSQYQFASLKFTNYMFVINPCFNGIFNIYTAYPSITAKSVGIIQVVRISNKGSIISEGFRGFATF